MTSGVYFPNNLSIHLYSQVLAGSDLCDVIIEVANQRTIPCHAAVISCASDIIRELLELAQRDKNGKKVINISTACADSMFCVLNYIYTGTEVSLKLKLAFITIFFRHSMPLMSPKSCTLRSLSDVKRSRHFVSILLS